MSPKLFLVAISNLEMIENILNNFVLLLGNLEVILLTSDVIKAIVNEVKN
jgi:hypothetical protein